MVQRRQKELDNRVARCLRGREVDHLHAVAQADDAIGDLENFAQPMRDVDQPQTLGAEIAQQLEQPARVGLGQRGGRFVEQQDLGVERQGARDLHALLLPRRQRAQRRVGVDAAAHAFERRRRATVELLAIDDARQRAGSWPSSTLAPTSRSSAWMSSCRTSEMPSAIASAGLPGVRPLIVTVPSSGVWMPAATFISVDLPAPLPPTRPTISPAATSKSTPRSAMTPPKDFLIPSERDW